MERLNIDAADNGDAIFYDYPQRLKLNPPLLRFVIDVVDTLPVAEARTVLPVMVDVATDVAEPVAAIFASVIAAVDDPPMTSCWLVDTIVLVPRLDDPVFCNTLFCVFRAAIENTALLFKIRFEALSEVSTFATMLAAVLIAETPTSVAT
jgi:hypothetical protein